MEEGNLFIEVETISDECLNNIIDLLNAQNGVIYKYDNGTRA